MSHQVSITGMGIISCIGNNVEENFSSLINSRHGISEIEILETNRRGTLKTGEIKLTNEELTTILQIPENHNFI